MSHKDLNPVNRASPKRCDRALQFRRLLQRWLAGRLLVWSELTHPYFAFSEVGYEVEVFSPLGGKCEPDAMSDPDDASKWQSEDVISRGYKHDPEFMELLEETGKVDDIDVDRYDALVVAGGQGPMFTFEKAENLHAKFSDFYETGKPTAALCHGVAILRYAGCRPASRWSGAGP